MYQNDISTNNDMNEGNQDIELVTIPVQPCINTKIYQ